MVVRLRCLDFYLRLLHATQGTTRSLPHPGGTRTGEAGDGELGWQFGTVLESAACTAPGPFS